MNTPSNRSLDSIKSPREEVGDVPSEETQGFMAEVEREAELLGLTAGKSRDRLLARELVSTRGQVEKLHSQNEHLSKLAHTTDLKLASTEARYGILKDSVRRNRFEVLIHGLLLVVGSAVVAFASFKNSPDNEYYCEPLFYIGLTLVVVGEALLGYRYLNPAVDSDA